MSFYHLILVVAVYPVLLFIAILFFRELWRKQR